MAAGILPKPGTKFGPCEDENCQHRDCIENRKMANENCTICGLPIGYETRFYESQKDKLEHAICVEEKIEKEQKPD